MAEPKQDSLPPDAEHDVELQQFLLYLGSALTAAGEAVNEVQDHLRAVAAAYGATRARFAVLPTFVVVALDPSRPATLEPTPQLRGVLRLDQTSALFDILKRATRAEIDPADGSRRVLEVIARPSKYRTLSTLAGHVVLTVGICLILQPTWSDRIRPHRKESVSRASSEMASATVCLPGSERVWFRTGCGGRWPRGQDRKLPSTGGARRAEGRSR